EPGSRVVLARGAQYTFGNGALIKWTDAQAVPFFAPGLDLGHKGLGLQAFGRCFNGTWIERSALRFEIDRVVARRLASLGDEHSRLVVLGPEEADAQSGGAGALRQGDGFGFGP